MNCQLPECGSQLDLSRHIAELIGKLERLLAASVARRVVGLGNLEVAPQGEQRAHRLSGTALPRQLDRPLEAPSRLLEVADAAEDATEGEMSATGDRGLPESIRQALSLLGRVDREHVVAGLDVERGRFLVELDQLSAGIAVLEQVDPLLKVSDRRLPVRLVPEPEPIFRCSSPARARLPVLSWNSSACVQLSTAASTCPERNAVSPRLSSTRARSSGSSPDGRRQRVLVVREGLGVGVHGCRRIAGRLGRASGADTDPQQLLGREVRLLGERRGSAVVLREQRRRRPPGSPRGDPR